MFDVVIAGGTVVDGSGSAGYRADVGIAGEKIEAIGDLAAYEARRVVDARGWRCRPASSTPTRTRRAPSWWTPSTPTASARGITTEFLGIDGMSYAPLSSANYLLYRRWLGGLWASRRKTWT